MEVKLSSHMAMGSKVLDRYYHSQRILTPKRIVYEIYMHACIFFLFFSLHVYAISQELLVVEKNVFIFQ